MSQQTVLAHYDRANTHRLEGLEIMQRLLLVTGFEYWHWNDISTAPALLAMTGRMGSPLSTFQQFLEFKAAHSVSKRGKYYQEIRSLYTCLIDWRWTRQKIRSPTQSKTGLQVWDLQPYYLLALYETGLEIIKTGAGSSDWPYCKPKIKYITVKTWLGWPPSFCWSVSWSLFPTVCQLNVSLVN